VVKGGQKYHLANKALTLDLGKLQAAVGPVEQAEALGIPTNDCLRLFEMYASIVSALMERCNTEPNPAGHGSDLPPVLQRILEIAEPTDTAADAETPTLERRPTLHVMRGSVHVGGDGETVFT